MPDSMPTLTAEQREELALMALHALRDAWRDEYSAQTVADKMTDALAPLIARMVADAEERGRAEVSAAVEAAFAKWHPRYIERDELAQQVRDALADPAAAVARIKAEAGCELQRSGDGTHGPLIRQAKAEALREAADKWQWGEWTVLTAPIKAASQPQRIIGAAQAVTDWLRDRADRIGGDT